MSVGSGPTIPVTPRDRATEEGRRSAGGRGDLRGRIVRGSAWVFAGKVVASVLGITVNALLARLLGHGELGAYFILLSGVMFGGAVATVGMDKSIVRLVGAARGRGDPAAARAAVSGVFRLAALGVVAMGSLIALVLVRLVTVHEHAATGTAIAILAAGWLVAFGLQTLVAESFRGFQDFRLATLADGLIANAFAVAVLAALWAAGVRIELRHALLVVAGGLAASALVCGGVLARRVGRLPRAPALRARSLLAVSWPYLVNSGATFLVATGVDVWILGVFRPNADVALYGAAARLVWFVATPLIVVSQVVPPIIAELHARGDYRRLERSMRAVATVTALPSALVLVVFLAAGRPLMGLVYGDFYRAGALVLAVLAFSRLFAVWSGNSGTALLMTGNQRTMMAITCVSGAVAVGLELALGWRFGMTGVACGSAAGSLCQNTLQLLYSKRRLGIWTHADLRPSAVLALPATLAASRRRRGG